MNQNVQVTSASVAAALKEPDPVKALIQLHLPEVSPQQLPAKLIVHDPQSLERAVI
jgi:hypothetical protein